MYFFLSMFFSHINRKICVIIIRSHEYWTIISHHLLPMFWFSWIRHKHHLVPTCVVKTKRIHYVLHAWWNNHIKLLKWAQHWSHVLQIWNVHHLLPLSISNLWKYIYFFQINFRKHHHTVLQNSKQLIQTSPVRFQRNWQDKKVCIDMIWWKSSTDW